MITEQLPIGTKLICCICGGEAEVVTEAECHCKKCGAAGRNEWVPANQSLEKDG